MNIFGAFTFGSLIKTFIPGFVWLIALVLLETALEELAGNKEPALWSYVSNKEQAAVVLAIFGAVLLGLLSNILVFMGINDKLVRFPVQASNAELCALYDSLAQRVRDRYWSALEGIDQGLRSAFNKNIDPELVLLHGIGVEKIAYVREQYWYHLEFQLNLLLSIGAVAVAAVVWILLKQPISAWGFFLALSCGLFALLAMRGLVLAARKNYARHLAKIATIMAAALYRSPPEEPAV